MRGSSSKGVVSGASAAMLVCAAINLSSACSESAVPQLVADAGNVDAFDGPDPNACMTCASLAAVCAEPPGKDPGSALECPPDLDSPDLYAWAERQLKNGFRYRLSCSGVSTCPSSTMIVFGHGVDCETGFIFDANTKKLRARVSACNGWALSSCRGADGCFQNRCLPTRENVTFPSACPNLPQPPTGIADGSCGPQAVVNPTSPIPAYKPYQRQAVCSSAQMAAAYDACVGPNGNQTACTAWGNDPNNVACGACVFTPATAAGFGPVVAIVSRDTPLNMAGCLGIVLNEGASVTGCGAAQWAFDRCVRSACPAANCCADTASCTPAEKTALDVCKQASYAAGGPCEGTAIDLSTKCAALTTDAGAAESSCGTGATTSERDRALAIMSTFCGMPVVDAGGD